MQCPVCKSQEHCEVHLKSDQFAEDFVKCKVCGSTWSVSHGQTEMVKDTQAKSFLEGTSESVEGDDYTLS